MSKTSKLPPRQPCYVFFDGWRMSGRPGYGERVCEPMQVLEVEKGQTKELAVVLFGRVTKYPLSVFSGEWEILETGQQE